MTKRPPRKVWLAVLSGASDGVFGSKREADSWSAQMNKLHGCTYEVAGPYILAERVRQR